MRISRHAGLRAIGGAAAYVLALHTMLFGLAATPSLRAAATGSLAVELCLSGGPAGAAAPDHSGRDHCAGCLTAGGARPPPPASPHPIGYASSATAAPSAVRSLPRPPFAGRPGLPRAPPSILA